MRKLIIGVFAASILFTGCKSTQKLRRNDSAETETVKPEEPATKVFSAPSTQPTYDQPANSQAKTYTSSNPVRTQSENFTFAQQADAGKYKGNFFVIIGSFSSAENADRYKQELIPQGFNPIVLHSETGYYRVCVNSYTDEAEARQRVNQIRNDYPKYADTWLLIKK